MPQLGDTLRFTADLYDKPVESGGVLVNATTATLTITRPDGTTATPTVPAPGTTGKYAVDFATVVGGPTGTYRGAWLFTLAGGITSAYQESFEVSASVVTLDEVLAHLRAAKLLTKADDLDQLEWLAAVATDAIERDLGRPLLSKTVTEKYDGGEPELNLRTTPVLSVTTVTEGAATVTAAGYVLDQNAGILCRGTTSGLWRWQRGRQNITVTYVAGFLDPPAVACKVALTAIERMWQTSQQAGHPLLDDVTAEAAVFTAYGTLTPIEQAGYNALRAHGV